MFGGNRGNTASINYNLWLFKQLRFLWVELKALKQDSSANRSDGWAHRLAHILCRYKCIYILSGCLLFSLFFPGQTELFDGAGQLRLRWILIAGYIRISVLCWLFGKVGGKRQATCTNFPAARRVLCRISKRLQNVINQTFRPGKNLSPVITYGYAPFVHIFFHIFISKLVATKSALISTHPSCLELNFALSEIKRLSDFCIFDWEYIVVVPLKWDFLWTN